jgi:hypothetical protein
MANLKKKLGNEVCGAMYKGKRCYCKCESVAGIWVGLNIHCILKPIFTFAEVAEQITCL